MKKILSSILSASLVTSIASLVVSCRYPALNQGPDGTRLLIVTDSGSVGDHSFNERIYESIQAYSDRKPDDKNGGFDFASLGLSAKDNFVQPLKSDYESYVNSYKLGKYKGTDIFVLTGFQHEMSRGAASKIAGTDRTVIIVDSAALDGETNVIPLSFSSQLAGFSAAYDSAVWATTIDPKTNKMQGQAYANKNGISFGLYGGIASKNATGSYLWGFLVGMAYFNARVKQENQELRHLKLANLGINGELENLSRISPTDTRFFTGSFDVGGANRAGTNDNLGVDGGKADVIFPVAGIQILDTLSTNRNAYIIGVDVNQAIQFYQYKNRFITSAIKDFRMSLFDAFDHSKANRLNHEIIDGKLGGLINTGPAQGTFWDGTIPKPSKAWSHDLDQTTEKEGTKIPKSILDFSGRDEVMAEMMIDFFNATGPESQDFMTWSGTQGIEEIVKQLMALDYKLPLAFQ